MVTDLHPIITQLAPSDEQRPAVVARGSDVAVTAGAGAGKTRTLVARYLSLLADGMPLRTIVAITFTKKAAREMRTRVRQEIRQYLQTEGLPDAERLRWSDHYEALDAARIGTIHSLCAEILRHHPAAVGIDPRFDMLDEGQMALLQAQAVTIALGWASDNVEAAPLFDLFGDVGLQRVLSSMLAKRLDVADAWAQLADDPWGVWKPLLVAPIRAFLDDASVQAGFSELLALRQDGALDRAAAAGDALAPDLATALEHIDAIAAARAEGDWAGVSRRLATLRGCLKQKGRQANWAPATPKETISRLQACYDVGLALSVGKGIDLDLDQHVARAVVPALRAVFEQARDAYDRAKVQRQALDFDDLETTALRLLEVSPEARVYWQQEIRALLVDEFQDTNERQRVLLQALNGAQGKLFIVGDAKQSIYRFRGADVTVFRTEREEIAAHGQGLGLVTSYRAHRAMVEALNALLRPVLGEQEDPHRPYVEPFSELAHYRDAPAKGLQPPYVELHLVAGSKTGAVGTGALDRAARALVARLADLVERGGVTLPVWDEESGAETMRPLSYGDVAILCRASTAFPDYENALEQAGIPYLTIAGRGFYDRPEVRDVLNALRTLADPTDDLALAGLLRSPAFGLSDMALYRLRTAQRAAARVSLWEQLLVDAAPPAALSDLGDETPRAAYAAALIGRLHQMVGRTPVADVLKAFLDATAYRAILLRTGAARATANIDKLLSDAHASGIVSVDAFVETLAELRDVASREGEARSLATGAVQIMSVHQAKGLEFPVVVIGDASRSSPRGGGAFVLDRELGIVPHARTAATQESDPVLSLAYALAQRREEDQEAAESDRLLYVAATRVRELLLVSGTVGVTKSGGLSLAGWLKRLDPALSLTAQAPACADTGDAVRTFALPLGTQSAQCTLYEPEAPVPPIAVMQRVAQGAEQAPPDDLRLLEPVAGLAAQADAATNDADRDPPRRVWRVVPRTPTARAPAWVVGELVHLALRDWAFPDDGDTDFYAWSAAEARNLGLTDDARIEDAVRRSARMLTRFQVTNLYDEMTAAERWLSEVPYSVLDREGRVDIGAIDALYRYEGRWRLVEFKTDALEDTTDLSEPPHTSDYVEQVERYLAAVEHLLGERPEPVLCYLNCGGRVHLVTDRW